MKTKIVLILAIMSLSASAGASGGVGSGGGSGYAADFVDTGYQAVKIIRGISTFPVSPDLLMSTILATHVEFTDNTLKDPNGLEVDALNTPSQHLIQVNTTRWFNLLLAPKQKLQLVTHEYLGILGIDDHAYSVSRQVLDGGIRTKSMLCQYDDAAGFHGVINWYQLSYDGSGNPDETRTNAVEATKEYPNLLIALPDPSTAMGSQGGAMAMALSWSGMDALYVSSIPMEFLTQQQTATFTEPFFYQKDFGPNGPVFEKMGMLSCEVCSE